MWDFDKLCTCGGFLCSAESLLIGSLTGEFTVVIFQALADHQTDELGVINLRKKRKKLRE